MLHCSLVWGGRVSLLLLFAILCLGGLCQSFQVSQDTTVVAVLVSSVVKCRLSVSILHKLTCAVQSLLGRCW